MKILAYKITNGMQAVILDNGATFTVTVEELGRRVRIDDLLGKIEEHINLITELTLKGMYSLSSQTPAPSLFQKFFDNAEVIHVFGPRPARFDKEFIDAFNRIILPFQLCESLDTVIRKQIVVNQ